MTSPEFSRPIAVCDLKDSPKSFEIEATVDERSALAARFSLLSVDALTANIRLTPQKNGLVRLEGDMNAKVRQSCVVTLEPVESLIEASFDQLHGSVEDVLPPKEIELSVSDDEAVEPFVDGAIDLGEVAAEGLALELEPFPRKPDTDFEEYACGEGDSEEEETKNHPFSKLAKLINE